MAGWYAKPLGDVPAIAPEQSGNPTWHPLQHHLGVTAFGANAYVAPEAGVELLETHDETASGQEELYVVAAGSARFTLDGEEVVARAPFVVAVVDPAVTRSAVAGKPGTIVLAFGGEPRADFRSSWNERWFAGIPRAGDGGGPANGAD